MPTKASLRPPTEFISTLFIHLTLPLSPKLSSVLSKNPPDSKAVLDKVCNVVPDLVPYIFSSPSSSVSNKSVRPGRVLLWIFPEP